MEKKCLAVAVLVRTDVIFQTSVKKPLRIKICVRHFEGLRGKGLALRVEEGVRHNSIGSYLVTSFKTSKQGT